MSACIQGRRPGLGGPQEQPSPPPGPLLGPGPYSFYRQVDIRTGPHRIIISVIASSTTYGSYSKVIFSFKFPFFPPFTLVFVTVEIIIHTYISTFLKDYSNFTWKVKNFIIKHSVFSNSSGSAPQSGSLSWPGETCPSPASTSSRSP